MRILLLNVPHPGIGSRIPDEHLPPLHLLAVGGPLLDAGHEVRLLDADFDPLTSPQILTQVQAFHPQAILLGHSGSSSGHPIIAELSRALRAAMPDVHLIYGGSFPTFHWHDVLAQEPQIDLIVRGEGEATAARAIHALEHHTPLDDIPGIAFRRDGQPYATPPAEPIENLDAYRIGWELVDLARYSYWGNRRAVVVQFSRGCPHFCSYCGQRAFWTRWRHRDPRKFAAEIAWLHRTHGVEVFDFADENPTASKSAWKEFLEALIAENVLVTLIGSTRADAIVRDADILHLYKKAGITRWLLGIENYDEATLIKIRKGASTSTDRQAIQLLRQHNIISMGTWVVGFAEETPRDYLHGLKQLLSYDPDQVQIIYATPHRWTPFFDQESQRKIIQPDQRLWDYKHQVLATRHMAPWHVMLSIKLIEAIMQLRPRALWRLWVHPDAAFRSGMRWYYLIGRRVWFYEIFHFLLRDKRTRTGPTLAEFWKPSPPTPNAATEIPQLNR